MHVQHCDITYDVRAPFNNITSANKMMHFGRAASEAHPPPKLPKTAVDRQEHHGNGTPRVPGVLHNATPSPMYLGASP